MPNEKPLPDVRLQQAEASQHVEQDEVDEVLTALRLLLKKVSSPVIRVCLESARSDIVHLASVGEDLEPDESADDLEDDDFDEGESCVEDAA